MKHGLGHTDYMLWQFLHFNIVLRRLYSMEDRIDNMRDKNLGIVLETGTLFQEVNGECW